MLCSSNLNRDVVVVIVMFGGGFKVTDEASKDDVSRVEDEPFIVYMIVLLMVVQSISIVALRFVNSSENKFIDYMMITICILLKMLWLL